MAPRRPHGWVIAGILLIGAIHIARADASDELNAGPVSSGCEYRSCTLSPWEAKVGIVMLQRSGLPSQVLARGLGEPVQEVNADQFGFGFEGGPDLTILRRGDRADLEFRWFQNHDWIAETPTLHESFGFAFPFRYLLGVVGAEGVDLSTRYASQLNSFELNLKRSVNEWIAIFGGLRFVELNEDLVFNAHALGSDPFHLHVRSFNDLYGVQAGSEIIVWNRGGPFRLLATGKAGIYGNYARNRADDGGIRPDYVDAASTGHTTFLGEIGVAGTYQITRRLSARVGYQLMWLDGVALAPQQEPRLDPAHDPLDFRDPSVATGGTAFYHGVVMGLDYRF